MDELETKAQQERVKRERDMLRLAREKELGEPELETPLVGNQAAQSTTANMRRSTREGPNGVKVIGNTKSWCNNG